MFVGGQTESVQLWLVVWLFAAGRKWWRCGWHSRNLRAGNCQCSSITGLVVLHKYL